MTKELFEQVVRWQKETFPEATALSKATHLKEEVRELCEDLATKAPNRRLEFGDCFLLLFGSAEADGMSYEDCCAAIEEKLGICKTRQWGQPDVNGVVKHIK